MSFLKAQALIICFIALLQNVYSKSRKTCILLSCSQWIIVATILVIFGGSRTGQPDNVIFFVYGRYRKTAACLFFDRHCRIFFDCNKFQKPLKFTTNIFIQAVNCFSTWFAHSSTCMLDIQELVIIICCSNATKNAFIYIFHQVTKTATILRAISMLKDH